MERRKGGREGKLRNYHISEETKETQWLKATQKHELGPGSEKTTLVEITWNLNNVCKFS